MVLEVDDQVERQLLDQVEREALLHVERWPLQRWHLQCVDFLPPHTSLDTNWCWCVAPWCVALSLGRRLASLLPHTLVERVGGALGSPHACFPHHLLRHQLGRAHEKAPVTRVCRYQ